MLPPWKSEVAFNLVDTATASGGWNHVTRLHASILAIRSSNPQSEHRILTFGRQIFIVHPGFNKPCQEHGCHPHSCLPWGWRWSTGSHHCTHRWNGLKLTANYQLSFPMEAPVAQINSRVSKQSLQTIPARTTVVQVGRWVLGAASPTIFTNVTFCISVFNVFYSFFWLLFF